MQCKSINEYDSIQIALLVVHWQVELENWVEASKPRNAAEKARAFVMEHKVFEVFPRSGALQPGESQQVGEGVDACMSHDMHFP